MQRVSVPLALVVVVMVAIGRTATAQTTYTQVLQQIFQPSCLSCHSSNLTGTARNGAPVGVNFDTFANAASTPTGAVNGQPNQVRANTRVQA